MKKYYSLGFFFNHDESEVLLIKKNKPEWQKNKLNGIGGHVEQNESFIQCMIREMYEESGISTDYIDWVPFFLYDMPTYKMIIFKATDLEDNIRFNSAQTKTDETIWKISLKILFNWEYDVWDSCHNIKWLIMMAKDKQTNLLKDQNNLWIKDIIPLREYEDLNIAS